MVPIDQDTILIGSDEGFFRFWGNTMQRVVTEVDHILESATLYHGTPISNGYLALATFGAGVLVIDHEGNLIAQFGEDGFLADGIVNYVKTDAGGGLWIATNNQGIARIDYPSPLMRYGRAQGLRGLIYDIDGFRDRIYVASGAGLYEDMEGSEPEVSGFREVDGVSQSWSVSASDDLVLAATDNGIFEVRDGIGVLVTPEPHFSIEKSSLTINAYIAGGINSYSRIRKNGVLSTTTVELDPSLGAVHSIVDLPDSTIWMGTKGQGLAIVSIDASAPRTRSFLKPSGIPDDHVVASHLLGKPVVAGVSGVYGIEAEVPDFVRLDEISGPTARSDSLLTFASDDAGRIWLVMSDRVEILRRKFDGRFERVVPGILRSSPAALSRIFVEESGVAWISRGDELFRYDPHVVKNYDNPYGAFVRRQFSE
jgi:hypothetical protein